MSTRRRRSKAAVALAYLAEKAVRFANTVEAHGEAWDTETDVLNAAIAYAATLSKRSRNKIGAGGP
jgi:hypothetical protein